MKLTTNTDFKSIRFAKPANATDAVSLTESEVRQLYEMNFNNRRLEEIRDMFIFQCSTGLRWSDLRSLEAKNIIDRDGWKFVILRSKKTNEYSEIPCGEYGIAVLHKYRHNSNSLPNVRSDQEYNRMIKEACKTAGLTAKSRLNTDLNRELWECIASHTARRTCFTLLYKSGFPIVELMRISGHKSMKSLMGYLKISAADAADMLRKHYEKQAENATTLLRAV
jgi:integrase